MKTKTKKHNQSIEAIVTTPVESGKVGLHSASSQTFCTDMKLLILDLDETLIHGRRSPLDRPPEFLIDDQFYIYARPHLQSFLEYAFAHFKVAVWTSASASYATAVLKVIMPDNLSPEFLWSNARCTKRKNIETWDEYWVKNLRKVKKLGYDLNSVLMIDDSPHKLTNNYGNYIQVSPYEGDNNDHELLLLPQYLESLKNVENVRKVEKREWKKKMQNQSIEAIVTTSVD